MYLTTVLVCSPISTPPPVPQPTCAATRRTNWSQTTTPSRTAATKCQPPRPATCHTTQSRQKLLLHLQRHPREHHRSRNNADATNTRLRATCQTPVKQPSSKERERTPCVHVDVRQSRPTHATTTRRRVGAVAVVVPRRPPTQAAKAAITKVKHHNKRRNDNTSVVSRESLPTRNLRTLTEC
jgi:hypothetical protein